MESNKIKSTSSNSVAPKFKVAAGFFLILGVLFGALGAHAMERVLDRDNVNAFVTASHYLLFMGAAMLGASSSGHEKGLSWVFWGTLLFSGSIFGLLLGRALEIPMSFLGPVTPIGGLLIIAGWTKWTYSILRWSSGRNMGDL